MKVSSKLVVFLRTRTMKQRAKTDKKRAEAVVADAEEKKQALRIKELSAEAELAKHRSREAVAEKTREVNRAKEGRAAEKKSSGRARKRGRTTSTTLRGMARAGFVDMDTGQDAPAGTDETADGQGLGALKNETLESGNGSTPASGKCHQEQHIYHCRCASKSRREKNCQREKQIGRLRVLRLFFAMGVDQKILRHQTRRCISSGG